MKLLTLKALVEKTAETTEAVYQGPDIPLPTFSIDTRTLQPGDLYVAIRGAHFDGHQFVKEALQKGACGVMVEKPMGESLGVAKARTAEIIVKDTALALGEMAKKWREQFHIPVLSVTGSCGKSGTKEMMAAILSQMGPTLFTKGNLNNHLGMPLMLLTLREHHRFAVVEMGASRPGDIRYLMNLCKPTLGLITNIQAAHLEGLGSLSGISKEKSEIYRGLPDDGVAVVNIDEPFATEWKDAIRGRHQVTFSLNPSKKADITATHIAYTSEGVRFELVTPVGSQDMFIPLLGDHVIPNALASIAATMAVGASLSAVSVGLQSVKPMKGRMLAHEMSRGIRVIDDTYNASASSVENALKYLSKVPGKKIFVMSHMAEMGPDSDEYHTKMGRWILHYGIDRVFFTGNSTWLRPALEVAERKAEFFPSQSALIDTLKPFLDKPENQGAVVLVKGCRSCKMEGIVERLMEQNHG
jgi:UDP-N-acetylmuramoyl-tripeptide--D-alanyl-D-alanine ligase